ncbi:unnamed protein product, partial [Rotaria sp. Silwood2]
MAEQKVPINEVVRQISNTLPKHGEVIQRIQETLGSIQPQLDSQIATQVYFPTTSSSYTHFRSSPFHQITKSSSSLSHKYVKIPYLTIPLQLHDISHTDESLPPEVPKFSDSILCPDQQKCLCNLLQSFSQVFTNTPGRTNKIQHHIDVQPGSKPRNSAPYRYAPARRQIIEDKINKMLNEGIIVPSKSPWASPVVLAPEKDGFICFCIDYRKLNEITIRDAYPIPRIDDTLDALQHAHFVSTLDLRSGYWQVEMDASSKALTAFVTHKGLFECTVMLFGLTNAPATFQRLMNIVLSGLKWQCCLVCLDDIIVYSSTFEQHLEDLRKVFLALADANLTRKASKCNFCRREMKFLGHLITPDGIKPDPGLIATIEKFPEPTNIKAVQAFL